MLEAKLTPGEETMKSIRIAGFVYSVQNGELTITTPEKCTYKLSGEEANELVGFLSEFQDQFLPEVELPNWAQPVIEADSQGEG
jgi:hypothetical protein